VNKSELVARLTDRLGGDRATATAAVNGVLEEISHSVARGERVSLIGFGTFDRRERAARTGRNPQTGAAIQLAASVAPVFRSSAGFRSLLTPNGALTAVQEAVTAVVPPIVVSEAVVAEKKPKKTAKKEAAAKAAKKTPKKAAGKDVKKAAKKAR
jgi:DNA-binding protein HU-beta